MNFAFLVTPPDNDPVNAFTMGARSKDFALTNSQRTQNEFGAAESTLDKVQRDNDEDTFHGGSRIARAEEELEVAMERREHATLKYKWEQSEQWKRKPPGGLVERTKRLLSLVNWDRLFKRS